jgi:predicted HTH domain antitoxin
MSEITTLHIKIPTEFAGLLGAQQQAAEVAKEFIILGLYQEGRISGGKAAEMLGMTRHGFVSFLARKGIDYFQIFPEEWDAEVATARQWTASRA